MPQAACCHTRRRDERAPARPRETTIAQPEIRPPSSVALSLWVVLPQGLVRTKKLRLPEITFKQDLSLTGASQSSSCGLGRALQLRPLYLNTLHRPEVNTSQAAPA